MKKTILIITALIILTVAVVFAVLWYTNGGESVQPLYLKSSDGAVLTKSITLQKEGQVEYEIKSAGFSRQTEVDEYTIAIQPNLTNDFNYEVGNNRYAFSAAGDLTEYFEITREGNKFTLVTDGTTTISSILTRKHGGEVTLPTLYETESYLNLLIITADNRLTLSVYITISDGSEEDITISDGSDEDITISDGSEEDITISDGSTDDITISDGSTETLSDDAVYFIEAVDYVATSGVNGQLAGLQMTLASERYSNLTDYEKTNAKVVQYYCAYEILSASLIDNKTITEEARNQAKSVLGK